MVTYQSLRGFLISRKEVDVLNNQQLLELDVNELWAVVERMEKERKEQENKILKHIQCGNKLFFSEQYKYREGILHPCANEKYPYQFTYFDEWGPIGDFCRNTLEEIAKGIVEYGFQPLETEERRLLL